MAFTNGRNRLDGYTKRVTHRFKNGLFGREHLDERAIEGTNFDDAVGQVSIDLIHGGKPVLSKSRHTNGHRDRGEDTGLKLVNALSALNNISPAAHLLRDR